MDTREKLKAIEIEINALKGNPTFQEYVKINEIQKQGDEIASAIQRKINLYKAITHQVEEARQEQVRHQQTPPIAPPQVKQQIQQNREVPQEREAILDKKVQQATQEPELNLNAEPQDMGQDLEIPGLPEDIEFDEPQKQD
jgi:hypothetical protein